MRSLSVVRLHTGFWGNEFGSHGQWSGKVDLDRFCKGGRHDKEVGRIAKSPSKRMCRR
jgi:hypothetical protein